MKKIQELWNKSTSSKVIIVFVCLVIVATVASLFGNSDNSNEQKLESKKEITIINFSTMAINDVTKWCEENKIECYKKEEYSNTVKKGSFVSQSVKSGEKIYEGKKVTLVYSSGKEPTNEEKNALKQAESYSKTLHMSKSAIYDQLISQYGGKFPKEAAQYAIDNIDADWNANALAQAKSYQENLNMSKKAVYDQLISQYGGKFTKSEAQYAVDHLDD